MSDTFAFNREFRLKILALCLDDDWMSRHQDVIKPEYFERDEESAFVKGLLEFRERYKRSPRDPMDIIELCNGEYSTFIMDMYELSEDWDLALASDMAVEFAREQAAKLAILDSVDDIASGNIQKAIERMKKALEVGQHIESPGIDPIRDVDAWLMDYWSDKVPTGWQHVNNILEGGITPTELGIVMGSQNKGKSMTLIDLGYSAASLMAGVNVVHFSHEMRAQQVAKRYAARTLFRFPKRTDDLYEYAEDLVSAARKLLKGQIRIIAGKKTTAQIEAHLARLRAEGFDFGLVIDDYPDLITPRTRYSDRRFELSDIYDWLRGLAFDYNVPIWGASQGNRASLTKELVTIGDIAEDIQKASIADIIISLCQTYEEEQASQCRLFMAKVRDGRNHDIIQCKYYSEMQAIVSVGVSQIASKKDERNA